MKKLDTLEELQNWDDYRDFSKETMKVLEGGSACFVSKNKLDFQVDGKPWSGHAFLVGKRGEQAVRGLKKEGVVFREGLCKPEGMDLHVHALKPPKLCKEANKTLTKLRLGYKVIQLDPDDPADETAPATPPENEASADSAPAGAARPANPEARAKNLEQLKKMEIDIDRLLAALNK